MSYMVLSWLYGSRLGLDVGGIVVTRTSYLIELHPITVVCRSSDVKVMVASRAAEKDYRPHRPDSGGEEKYAAKQAIPHQLYR